MTLPKMFTPSSMVLVTVLCYMANGTLQMWPTAWIFRWKKNILVYPGGPNLITWVLKSWKSSLAVVREKWDRRTWRRHSTCELFNLPLLALQIEEGAMSQGIWAAFRSWEWPSASKETLRPWSYNHKEFCSAKSWNDQGNVSSLEPQERNIALLTPWF